MEREDTVGQSKSTGALAGLFNMTSSMWTNLKIVCTCMFAVNNVISFVLLAVVGRPFNLTKILRPIMLIGRLRHVQRISSSIIAILPSLFYPILVLFMFLLLSSMSAYVLFRGVAGPPDRSERNWRKEERNSAFFPI